jgi:uncharacterized protein (DUF885 family)
MKRLFLLPLLIFLAFSSAEAQNAAEENLDKLAAEILENLQSFYPVVSTARGIRQYDHNFTDYSANSIRAEISKLKKFQSRLGKIKFGLLSAESQIDWRLLKSDVDIELQNLERIKWHQKNPYLYVDDAINGVYLISISESPSPEERAQNIIARMKAVPDLFLQAKANLKKPAPVYVELAMETLANGIDFYASLAERLKIDNPALASDISRASEEAIAAMKDFRSFLEHIPRGREESFAIGKDDFDFKLKNQYFLDFDADSLLRIGEALFDKYDSLKRAYELQLDSNRVEIDSVYPYNCISKEEILRYYQWEVELAKNFLIQKNILTVPDDIAECRVVETPPFLRNIIAGIAYEPAGAFSEDQTGHFYVRPLPDSLDDGQKAAYSKFINRRGFKGSVVHEAYPGHHLQFVMTSRILDDVRKWHYNLCYIEGWALYCEEMMYESGFYGADKRRYLNILGGILFRAARIIVDVKLHTGKMTVDEAVDWMSKALDSDTAFIRTEINRYTMNPTVPMSYLIGKIDVLGLRDGLKAREGDRFSLKGFHDRFLSEGMLPPRLIRQLWGLK